MKRVTLLKTILSKIASINLGILRYTV